MYPLSLSLQVLHGRAEGRHVSHLREGGGLRAGQRGAGDGDRGALLVLCQPHLHQGVRR